MITSILRDVVTARAEDLLCAIGLERRRRTIDHVFTATTYFLAGAIVGSCAALLLAPTSGLALRNRIGEQLRAATERARRAADDMRSRVTTRQGAYDEAGANAS